MSRELTSDREKVIVGWRELVSFPEWGVRRVRAKIDTGARTSALHVDHVRRLPGNRVHFEAVLSRKDPSKRVSVEAPIVRLSRVRPSSGERQVRIVVAARIVIGPLDRVIEVSLVDRGDMLCRMLIGRTALGPDVVVDPSATYLHRKRRKRKTES